jgi:redox-regulated HSP33 family molecular chaperone
MIKGNSKLKTYLYRPSSHVIHLVDFESLTELSDHYAKDSVNHIEKLVTELLLFFALIKLNEKMTLNISFEKSKHLFILEIYPDGHFRYLTNPKQDFIFSSDQDINVRITKHFELSNRPYTSYVKVAAGLPLAQTILSNSYQMNGTFFLLKNRNRSALIVDPPRVSNIADESIKTVMTTQEMMKAISLKEDKLDMHLSEDLVLLKTTDLIFHCPCSKNYYLERLSTLKGENLSELFQDNRVQIQCDFCFKEYLIERREIESH